jgi:hypothetical protein
MEFWSDGLVNDCVAQEGRKLWGLHCFLAWAWPQAGAEKPLKRLGSFDRNHTSLKRGVNENGPRI